MASLDFNINFGRDEVSLNSAPRVSQSFGATVTIKDVGGIGYMWERSAPGQTSGPLYDEMTGLVIPGSIVGYNDILRGTKWEESGPLISAREVELRLKNNGDPVLGLKLALPFIFSLGVAINPAEFARKIFAPDFEFDNRDYTWLPYPSINPQSAIECHVPSRYYMPGQ